MPRKKTFSKCTIWWCDRPYYAKGFCHTHWTAQQRYGSPYGRHKEDFKFIDDIIQRTRDLVAAVNYPPGPTRDEILSRRAKEISDIIGK